MKTIQKINALFAGIFIMMTIFPSITFADIPSPPCDPNASQSFSNDCSSTNSYGGPHHSEETQNNNNTIYVAVGGIIIVAIGISLVALEKNKNIHKKKH